MAAPSSRDFTGGFDPTAQLDITGAQLLALIQSGTPYTDKGLVVVTTDIATVPQVPDARTGQGNEKWQKYIWVRVQAATAAAYIWSPNSALDATFLYWVQTSANLADGSITGDKIAPATITADKIVSLSWTQISGIPASGFIPGGPAGGALSGTYPNPSLADNTVSTSKYQANSINGAALSGTTGGSPCVDATKNLVLPSDPLQIIRSNAANAVYEYVNQSVIQRVVKVVAYATSVTGIPVDNTIPQVGEGSQFTSIVFTPKSATSVIRFAFCGITDVDSGSFVMSFFTGASANAIRAWLLANSAVPTASNVETFLASPGTSAFTFSIRYGFNSGGAGTVAAIGGATGGARFSTAGSATVIIEELTNTTLT